MIRPRAAVHCSMPIQRSLQSAVQFLNVRGHLVLFKLHDDFLELFKSETKWFQDEPGLELISKPEAGHKLRLLKWVHATPPLPLWQCQCLSMDPVVLALLNDSHMVSCSRMSGASCTCVSYKREYYTLNNKVLLSLPCASQIFFLGMDGMEY